jgi:predicted aspartyl protease
MRVTHSFDGQSIPTIQITVDGILKDVHCPIQAGIDTGFTGFLSLPFPEAFKPGLILKGVMSLTLADGSTQHQLCCLGAVEFEGKSEVGVIIMSTSNDALVGIEFLRQFKLQLIVDAYNKTFTLTDEESSAVQP